MNISEKYDIVIVGAGPGGIMAALHSEGNVLLVEKKENIGQPIHCGEGLFSKVSDYFDIKDCLAGSNEIKNIEFCFPNGESKKLKLKKYSTFIMNKDDFLKKMLEKAKRKNKELTVETSTQAKVKNDFIVLNNKKRVYPKVTIAADGIGSGIGRSLGISHPLKKEDVHVCVQYTSEDSFDKNTARIFLGKPYAPTGYTWVFPKSNSKANIGLGVQASQKLYPKKYLDWFIKDHYPHCSTSNFFTAPVSLSLPVEKCMKDNVLLVGDAARFTFASSGGGISTALYSGMMAGEIASDYIAGKWLLETYQLHMKSMLYPKLQKAYKFKQRFVDDQKIDGLYRMFSILFNVHRVFPKTSETLLLRKIRF